MYAVTRNPPLVGYGLALAGSLFGWSERALHLVFLFPAWVAAMATLWLARRWAPAHATAVACLSVWTPAFLVCASAVMSDVPMLAAWLLAIACWLQAADLERARGAPPRRRAGGWRLAAGLFAALAVLTKYFAVSLVPLLALHALALRLPLRRWVPSLLLPLAALAGLELTMRALYGVGAIGQAIGEALHFEGIPRPALLRQISEGLAFAGGSVPPVLLFAPLLWGRRVLAGGVALLAAATALAPASLAWAGLPVQAHGAAAFFGPERVYALNFFAMVLGGVSLLALAFDELRRSRDAERLLLVAWVLGAFVFAAFVNWTNNGRSNLPLAPAAVVLVARRLGRLPRPPWLPAAALAALVSAALAFAVAWADRSWSNGVRDAARALAARHGDAERLWFHGHWGLQFYLERAGARPVDWRRDTIGRGELLIVASNNAETHVPAAASAELVDVLLQPEPRWLRT